jgi:hypothetical protein
LAAHQFLSSFQFLISSSPLRFFLLFLLLFHFLFFLFFILFGSFSSGFIFPCSAGGAAVEIDGEHGLIFDCSGGALSEK